MLNSTFFGNWNWCIDSCHYFKIVYSKSNDNDRKEKSVAKLKSEPIEDKRKDKMGMTEIKKQLLDRKAFGLQMKTRDGKYQNITMMMKIYCYVVYHVNII